MSALPRVAPVILFSLVCCLPGCGRDGGERPVAGASPGRGHHVSGATGADPLRAIQAEAVARGRSPYFHWGADPGVYAGYDGHSNRLIPAWVHGAAPGGEVDLARYAGARSVYRDAGALERLYGRVPDATLNGDARYLDQTDLYRLQRAALEAGRRHVFLVVFDGMDWQTLRLAAATRTGRVPGPGAGDALSFQRGGEDRPVQSGFMVTSPYGNARSLNVGAQTVGGVRASGGYDAHRGGATPWAGGQAGYLAGRDGHAVAESASSAVAMTTGEKTYNGAINRDERGRMLTPVAHLAQRRGMAVGSVTNVPFNHATAAAAYAHNVSRGDYQDLARDMLGLRSVSHPEKPLAGMDVVVGAGHGIERRLDAQGRNFVPGNRYLADGDLARVDASRGGRYRVVQRTSGEDGGRLLRDAARDARDRGLRLFGLFGTRYGHLPYATADGDHAPAPDADGEAESYDRAALQENPTLAEMTDVALTVLETNPEGFWLMVEPGDVDWANHANNVDNAVGSVFSGEAAVTRIIDWVEANSDWNESLLIVTADHGHLLVWDDPPAFGARVAGGSGNEGSEHP